MAKKEKTFRGVNKHQRHDGDYATGVWKRRKIEKQIDRDMKESLDELDSYYFDLADDWFEMHLVMIADRDADINWMIDHKRFQPGTIVAA